MSRDVAMYCENCGRRVHLNTTGTSTGRLCVCGGTRVCGFVTFTSTESGDTHIGGLVDSDPRAVSQPGEERP